MSSDQTITRRKVKCPQCGSLAFYTLENPFRPFCSERCRLIDLGAWASGKYTIPVQNSETLDQEIDQIDDQNHPVDHN